MTSTRSLSLVPCQRLAESLARAPALLSSLPPALFVKLQHSVDMVAGMEINLTDKQRNTTCGKSKVDQLKSRHISGESQGRHLYDSCVSALGFLENQLFGEMEEAGEEVGISSLTSTLAIECTSLNLSGDCNAVSSQKCTWMQGFSQSCTWVDKYTCAFLGEGSRQVRNSFNGTCCPIPSCLTQAVTVTVSHNNWCRYHECNLESQRSAVLSQADLARWLLPVLLETAREALRHPNSSSIKYAKELLLSISFDYVLLLLGLPVMFTSVELKMLCEELLTVFVRVRLMRRLDRPWLIWTNSST